MGEAEKLAAMTTDARIVAAIKSTDYKYFGDYEMSDGQRDAVDILVVAARELMKLRTDHLAALRRAKAEVLELAARELCMYCNDPGNWAPMSNSGYHQCNTPGPNMTRCGATKIHALRRELDARAAQIEEGSK